MAKNSSLERRGRELRGREGAPDERGRLCSGARKRERVREFLTH